MLFHPEYDPLLYDMTSTYFEGVAPFNGQAERGYARDHRPDYKQVCIAVVVARGGIPISSGRSLSENRSDLTTTEETAKKENQKEDRVKAHILVCFLAYVVWKTLGQICRRAGLGDEPRKVFDEIAQIKVVDVVMPTSQGITITKRCIAQTTQSQAALLQRLRLDLPERLKIQELWCQL